ncbi:metallophosphoesterase [Nocardioides sp. R-C-SC26]|uniref:metallophosphoesterase family protein n=1 Tax=Nocardioides sp. R-C-SC26 TaxID=2870414 RepID=UPI001E6121BB|nr:metallophosphoesterase [Nocardioides sp. R-C-SC26]
MPLSRRHVVATSPAATGAVSAGAVAALASQREGTTFAADRAPKPRVDSDDAALVTFVSTADLFNGDVGDLSVLPTWDGGPNSINDSWRRAIDDALGAVAAHRPAAVLVAGDLVEGHWNIDSDDRRVFGEVSQLSDPLSLDRTRQAITTAGGVYYGQYVDRFVERGLWLLPAVGDHELLDDGRGALDDRWSPRGVVSGGVRDGEPDNRYHLVPHCKQVWADHFTRPGGAHLYRNRPVGTPQESTAYAVDFGRALRVITVDVFDHTPAGVRLGVFGGQLTWLRRMIRTAKRAGRVVVVQGHIPITAPYRWLASGQLRVPQARDSGLYRVLAEERADFYFCGEVHDTTVQQRGPVAPVQVSHGSIFRYAFNFLVGRVYAGGVTRLDYYEMTVERASLERGLWSCDAAKRQRTEIEYGAPVLMGQLIAQGGRVLERTGKLAVYQGRTDVLGYRGNLHPEVI